MQKEDFNALSLQELKQFESIIHTIKSKHIQNKLICNNTSAHKFKNILLSKKVTPKKC